MSSEENTTLLNLAMSFLFAWLGVGILLLFEIDLIAQPESIDLPILALFGVLVLIGWLFGGWVGDAQGHSSKFLGLHRKKMKARRDKNW